VAYAANRLRVPATIFVPSVSSPAKIERIRNCGAQLVVTGASYADALAESQRWSATREVMSTHAFDQLETILGQETLGLELENQAPRAEPVLAVGPFSPAVRHGNVLYLSGQVGQDPATGRLVEGESARRRPARSRTFGPFSMPPVARSTTSCASESSSSI
jgi:hypothetical protein